jgi:hypothetical protein
MKFQISQKSCSDIDLAPPGCTQYYYGSGSGSVQSFNYDNNVLLANQIQNICFRYVTYFFHSWETDATMQYFLTLEWNCTYEDFKFC